jgi:site-specific DNA-methyltransferase (adenine-specific)
MFAISGLPGGSCLVPFMGSGSEMVAALRYGMHPAGFETDPQYFDISCHRIAAETHNSAVVQPEALHA